MQVSGSKYLEQVCKLMQSYALWCRAGLAIPEGRIILQLSLANAE